jgi:hypothetical protein
MPNPVKSQMTRMRNARVAQQAAKDPGVSIDDLAAGPAAAIAADNPAPKRRGRPPKVKPVAPTRDKRTTLKSVPRQATHPKPTQHATPRRDPTVQRTANRDPATGRVVVIRNGKTYTRRTINTEDKFHIDPADIPEGMSYQWISHTIIGQEQRNTMAAFATNGWEPVDLSRYPGRYAPPNATGAIILEGMMLVERPIELTLEARAEEIREAKNLIRTRNEQFTPKLPEALERRGTGLRAKRSIEGMPPDIGRPAYEMAVDEGLV